MITYKKLLFSFINIFIYIYITKLLTDILNLIDIKNIWLFNIYNLISPLIVTIILIIINKKLFKDKFKDLKRNKKEYFLLAIKYYICGLILMSISTNILSLFNNGALPQNEEANRKLLKLLPIYTIISSAIFAPISEELAFRGCFKDTFKNKYIYLIFTAFIFGFLHVAFSGDYINIIPYAALGYFLGLTYYETDNILLTILMHSFHNTLCLLLILGGSL